jgi:YbbR domain-containing protein
MQYTVSPSTVMIKGSPALIDSIHSIPAAVINESRVDSDTLSLTVTPDRLPLPSGVSLAETLGDVKISLNLPDNQSRVLTMQLNSTHVAVTPPSGEWNYQFADAAISFKIRGTSQAINQAEINDFYLNIDLSGLTAAGEYTVPVQIVQTSASQGQYYPVGDVTVTVSIQAQ